MRSLTDFIEDKPPFWDSILCYASKGRSGTDKTLEAVSHGNQRRELETKLNGRTKITCFNTCEHFRISLVVATATITEARATATTASASALTLADYEAQ